MIIQRYFASVSEARRAFISLNPTPNHPTRTFVRATRAIGRRRFSKLHSSTFFYLPVSSFAFFRLSSLPMLTSFMIRLVRQFFLLHLVNNLCRIQVHATSILHNLSQETQFVSAKAYQAYQAYQERAIVRATWIFKVVVIQNTKNLLKVQHPLSLRVCVSDCLMQSNKSNVTSNYLHKR